MAICNNKMTKNYDPKNFFDVHLPNDAIECLDSANHWLEISRENFFEMGSSDINLYKISNQAIE